MNRLNIFLSFTSIFLAVSLEPAFAGPPFITDDPQTVDLGHWEFYVSSQMDFTHNDVDITAPQIEVNYGAAQDVQLHIITPLGYVKTEAGKAYGYKDTEAGVKIRLINTEDGLMVGIFPIAEFPTGVKSNQLGNGKTQLYLPAWIQKSWGKLQTYGGLGYWINPGTGNKNYVFAGWQAQYDFSSAFTLGGEVYYKSRDSQDAVNSAGFNLGGNININGLHHILFSFGKLISLTSYTGYLGYQLTI